MFIKLKNKFLRPIAHLTNLGLFAFASWPTVYNNHTALLTDGAVLNATFEAKCQGKGRVYKLSVAHSEAARQKGLSNRSQQLARNEGMLFVFDAEEPVTFWMKQTFIPLQIVYIRTNGTIARTSKMSVEPNPDMPKALYSSGSAVNAAVELAPGSLSTSNRLHFCIEVPSNKSESSTSK